MKEKIGILLLLFSIFQIETTKAQSNYIKKKIDYHLSLSPVSEQYNDTIVSKYNVEIKYDGETNLKNDESILFQQLIKNQIELIKIKSEREINNCSKYEEIEKIFSNYTQELNRSVEELVSLKSVEASKKKLIQLDKEILKERSKPNYIINKKNIGIDMYLGIRSDIYGNELSKYYENCPAIELGYGVSYKDLCLYLHLNYGKLESKQFNFEGLNSNISEDIDKTEVGTTFTYTVFDTHKWRIAPSIRYDYAMVSKLLDERNTDKIHGAYKISAGVDTDYILSRRLCLRPKQFFGGKEIEDIAIRGSFNVGYMKFSDQIKGMLVQFGISFNIYGRLIH